MLFINSNTEIPVNGSINDTRQAYQTLCRTWLSKRKYNLKKMTLNGIDVDHES